MKISRREKYSGQGRTISFSEKKIKININLDVLDAMCAYVISENQNITRGQLMNLRNFIDVLDLEMFVNDSEKLRRLRFIKKGLEGRLLNNISDRRLIIQYATGKIDLDVDSDYLSMPLLSNDDIQFINKSVATHLKFSFIYNDVDRMLDICTRFKACDYKNIEDIVNEYQEAIQESQNKFRKVDAEVENDQRFSLKQDVFENIIKNVYDKVINPSRNLITGMRGVNEILGGGFRGGEEYMFVGLAGTGKSLTIEDIAFQIKKYNPNYKTKDPTKIPVVLYLTMENTLEQSVTRLFEMEVERGGMENFSYNDVLNLMKTEGELFLSGDNPIDVIIKYVPNRSVDTSYLYTITEDLEDEGYEVICVIQDHVKRIRSIERTTDIRIELGNVVNEFRTFCILKDIPFITISHLNRNAARVIDEGMRDNKVDLLRQVGRSDIGESMLMLDNLDGCFMLGKEFDKQGNVYMGFGALKQRFKHSNRSLVYIPYTTSNGVKLMEDVGKPIPCFKDTLKELPQDGQYDNGLPAYNNTSQYEENIKSIDDLLTNNNTIKAKPMEVGMFENIQLNTNIVNNNEKPFGGVIVDLTKYREIPVQNQIGRLQIMKKYERIK